MSRNRVVVFFWCCFVSDAPFPISHTTLRLIIFETPRRIKGESCYPCLSCFCSFSPCRFAYATLLLQMISSPFTPRTFEDLSLRNGGSRSRLMSLSSVLSGNDSLVPFSPLPLHSPVYFFEDEVSEDPSPFNLEDLALSLEARPSSPSGASNRFIDGQRAHHDLSIYLVRASSATPTRSLFGFRFSPCSSRGRRATPVQSLPASTSGASNGFTPIFLVGGIESPVISPGSFVGDSLPPTPSIFKRANSPAAPTRSRSPFSSGGRSAMTETLRDSHPPFAFSASDDVRGLTPLPLGLNCSNTALSLGFTLDGFTCQDLLSTLSCEASTSPARDGFVGKHSSFLDGFESPVISHALFVGDSLTPPCKHNPGGVNFCRLGSPSITGYPKSSSLRRSIFH
jgi:hypothetical protein